MMLEMKKRHSIYTKKLLSNEQRKQKVNCTHDTTTVRFFILLLKFSTSFFFILQLTIDGTMEKKFKDLKRILSASVF